jgi:hypothetical protein
MLIAHHGIPVQIDELGSHQANIVLHGPLAIARDKHSIHLQTTADANVVDNGEQHDFTIEVVVVVSTQDLTSKMLSGSGYSFCIHNLHAIGRI